MAVIRRLIQMELFKVLLLLVDKLCSSLSVGSSLISVLIFLG